jgi:hypothetical protein
MLSTTTTASSLYSTSSTSTSESLPVTFQQKERRIERLPYYMRTFEPDRYMPKSAIQQIQQGLLDTMGELQKPPTETLDSFNLTLRDIVSKPSLSAADARRLNHAFVQVLQASGAPGQAIDELSAGLTQLTTQVDTASIRPVFLATNDYSVVLQTALAVGRPLPAPKVPQLALKDGTQVNAGYSITPVQTPAFVGSYEPKTVVQLLDTKGHVLGSAETNSGGRYRLQVESPLALGVHELHVRGTDSQGHESILSRAFQVKVVESKQS